MLRVSQQLAVFAVSLALMFAALPIQVRALESFVYSPTVPASSLCEFGDWRRSRRLFLEYLLRMRRPRLFLWAVTVS